MVYSLRRTPRELMCPILFALRSVNQRLPSEAVVMPVGAAVAVGRGENSVTVEGTQRSSSDSTASRIRDGFGLGHCRLVCRRVTRWNREWSKFITNLPDTNVGMSYARTIGLRGGAFPDRDPLARWHGPDSPGVPT